MAVHTFFLLRHSGLEGCHVLQVLLHALLVPLAHAVVGQEDVKHHHQHLQQADTDLGSETPLQAAVARHMQPLHILWHPHLMPFESEDVPPSVQPVP